HARRPRRQGARAAGRAAARRRRSAADRGDRRRPARLRPELAAVPVLERDGRSLFFEEAGSGPPVLLVHGWCCDPTYLGPQRAHLATRFRVVALDLVGHGRSDKPEGPYPLSRFADDVAWLAEHLGLHRPLVIGHSMGGGTAIELAARHPALPRAIVM